MFPLELFQYILNYTPGITAFNLVYSCKYLSNMRPRYYDDYKMFNVFILHQTTETYRILALLGISEAFIDKYYNLDIICKAYEGGNIETINIVTRNRNLNYDENYKCIRSALKSRNETIVSRFKGIPLNFTDKLFLYGYNSLINMGSITLSCSMNEISQNAFVNGDMHNINMIIKANYINWDRALYGACKGGNMKLALYAISNGARTDNFALKYACIGGNIEIVNMIIDEGNNDWNQGLLGSCIGGNIDLVKLMIEKGANNYDIVSCVACKYNHIEIVKLLIELIHPINNSKSIYFHPGIDFRPKPMHISSIVKFLHKYGYKYSILAIACKYGHIDMVNMLTLMGFNDYNGGLVYACKYGYVSIAKLMIELGADNISSCIYFARRKGYSDIVKMLIMSYKTKSK